MYRTESIILWNAFGSQIAENHLADAEYTDEQMPSDADDADDVDMESYHPHPAPAPPLHRCPPTFGHVHGPPLPAPHLWYGQGGGMPPR